MIQFNIAWYCISHCIGECRISILYWIYKRCSVSRCHDWVIGHWLSYYVSIMNIYIYYKKLWLFYWQISPQINSLWPSDAIWQHGSVNIASANSLLPDGTIWQPFCFGLNVFKINWTPPHPSCLQFCPYIYDILCHLKGCAHSCKLYTLCFPCWWVINKDVTAVLVESSLALTHRWCLMLSTSFTV